MHHRLQVSINFGYKSTLSKKVIPILALTTVLQCSHIAGNNLEQEKMVDAGLHSLSLDSSCKSNRQITVKHLIHYCMSRLLT